MADPGDTHHGADSQAAARRLTLQRIAGPEVPTIEIDAGGGQHHLGRAASNDSVLADASVSRQHALLMDYEGAWYLSDVGSRHGTVVNGMKVQRQDLVPLSAGDLISVGPWTFLVSVGATRATSAIPVVETGGEGRVETIDQSELDDSAQRRLSLLIDVADAIQSARSELELADQVLRAALSGTGFTNAAIVRAIGSDTDLEVLGFLSDSDETGDGMVFSRTLLSHARAGEFVRLTDDDIAGGGGETPVSIVQQGITSAMCAPIRVGTQVLALLYLDSRGVGARPHADAAAFCEAIARLCALAMSNLKRQELESRQRDFEREFDQARRAQQLIMPPPRGRVAGMRYAVMTEPGRMVAGDLVDLFELPDGRAAVVLGDVASKGVGAAMLMATTQAYLHGALSAHGDLARTVAEVNRHLHDRTADDKFVSLWVGVADAAERRIEFVDAGHGLWAVTSGTDAYRPECRGGIVLGVDAKPPTPYVVETLRFGPGDRLVLFSDGVVEQRNPGGAMYGFDRVMSLLSESTNCGTDVESIFHAVDVWAGDENFADDTSIVSVMFD